MDKKILSQLKKDYKTKKSLIKELNDPVDKINVLADFIKNILDSHGVKEVLLASPFGPDFVWNDYAEEKNYEDLTMADYVSKYQQHDKDFEWLEPNWICYGEEFTDSPYGEDSL